MIIETNKKFSGKKISYEIDDTGYNIYLSGNPWISQHGKYGKPFNNEKTYEENCLLQIDELTPSNIYGIPDTLYNSVVDDYTENLISEGLI